MNKSEEDRVTQEMKREEEQILFLQRVFLFAPNFPYEFFSFPISMPQ
jgi:hypothetical protein